jgi:hypothetical protein
MVTVVKYEDKYLRHPRRENEPAGDNAPPAELWTVDVNSEGEKPPAISASTCPSSPPPPSTLSARTRGGRRRCAGLTAEKEGAVAFVKKGVEPAPAAKADAPAEPSPATPNSSPKRADVLRRFRRPRPPPVSRIADRTPMFSSATLSDRADRPSAQQAGPSFLLEYARTACHQPRHRGRRRSWTQRRSMDRNRPPWTPAAMDRSRPSSAASRRTPAAGLGRLEALLLRALAAPDLTEAGRDFAANSRWSVQPLPSRRSPPCSRTQGRRTPRLALERIPDRRRTPRCSPGSPRSRGAQPHGLVVPSAPVAAPAPAKRSPGWPPTPPTRSSAPSPPVPSPLPSPPSAPRHDLPPRLAFGHDGPPPIPATGLPRCGRPANPASQAAGRRRPPSNLIHVAIIGTGNIAEGHLTTLLGYPERVRIVAGARRGPRPPRPRCRPRLTRPTAPRVAPP